MKKLGRDFYYLIIGQGFSRLGNNFFTLALLWYVLEETGSSVYVGFTALLLTVPAIMSMFTGTVVDKVNRWNLMISVEVIQITLTCVLAFMGIYMDLSIVTLITLTFIIQFAGSFFGPAENAVIPLLVKKEELLTLANSLNQSVTMISKIIGLALGGLLMAKYGPISLILINGVTFIISLISILLIKPWKFKEADSRAELEETVSDESSFYESWKTGLKIIKENNSLKRIIPIAILINFALAPLMSLNPVWVKDVLKLDAATYGTVEAIMFVGVIIGIILVNFLHQKFSHESLMPASLLVMSLSIIVLSQFPFLSVTLICMTIFGIAAGIVNTGIFTIMQSTTPNKYLGRVSGVLIGATNISLPIGMSLGSFLSATLSIGTIFLLGGICAVLGSIVAIGLKKGSINLSEEEINNESLNA